MRARGVFSPCDSVPSPAALPWVDTASAEQLASRRGKYVLRAILMLSLLIAHRLHYSSDQAHSVLFFALDLLHRASRLAVFRDNEWPPQSGAVAARLMLKIGDRVELVDHWRLHTAERIPCGAPGVVDAVEPHPVDANRPPYVWVVFDSHHPPIGRGFQIPAHYLKKAVPDERPSIGLPRACCALREAALCAVVNHDATSQVAKMQVDLERARMTAEDNAQGNAIRSDQITWRRHDETVDNLLAEYYGALRNIRHEMRQMDCYPSWMGGRMNAIEAELDAVLSDSESDDFFEYDDEQG